MAQKRSQRSEYWRGRIEAWLESGLTQAAFCERQGLSLSALRWWRWKLKRENADSGGSPMSREASPAMRLVPVRVVDPQGTAPSTSGHQRRAFEVILDKGTRIRVPQDFDAEALSRLVRTLEAVRC